MNNKFTLIILVIISLTSFAQSQKKESKVKIQFDEDLIKGVNDVPSGSRTMTRKEFNFKKMIKIRENFIPEIEGTGGSFDKK